MVIGVVTALNEAPTIGALVVDLSGFCKQVIVVDDGSNDGTGEIAEARLALVIRHNTSRGIAASLMEAWHKALELGADRILQMDAGGSHDPREAGRLINRDADLVIGSRFCVGAQYIGGKRKYFSRLYTALCNYAVAKKVTSDWTSGYRVFTAQAIQKLLESPLYWSKMHAWQAEIIHRAVRSGLTIAEAPINYRAGHSTFKAQQIEDAFMVWLKVMTL